MSNTVYFQHIQNKITAIRTCAYCMLRVQLQKGTVLVPFYCREPKAQAQGHSVVNKTQRLNSHVLNSKGFALNTRLPNSRTYKFQDIL